MNETTIKLVFGIIAGIIEMVESGNDVTADLQALLTKIQVLKNKEKRIADTPVQ